MTRFADDLTIQHMAQQDAEIERLRKERDEMIGLLERASVSLGAFVSDLGWAQADMDTMDSIDAALAKLGADKTGKGCGNVHRAAVQEFICPYCKHEQPYAEISCHNCNAKYTIDASAPEAPK